MNYNEYAYGMSEITQLEDLISRLPPDMEVERMGLEYRLARARERMKDIPIPDKPLKAYVTFQGDPVIRDIGIDSTFGADAMRLITDAASIGAASFAGDLKSTGAIPRKEAGNSVITAVATGSFGFEIELPTAGQESQAVEEESIPLLERAMESLQDLLIAAEEGNDTKLSELADEMHPRTVRKVGEFLKLLERGKARFALEFKDREFRVSTQGQLNNMAQTLADNNIHEESGRVTGTVIGIIPSTRRFQLNRQEDGEEIEGRIARTIPDPYDLAQRCTNNLVTAEISSVRIGRGRPRYTLVRVLEISEESVATAR